MDSSCDFGDFPLLERISKERKFGANAKLVASGSFVRVRSCFSETCLKGRMCALASRDFAHSSFHFFNRIWVAYGVQVKTCREDAALAIKRPYREMVDVPDPFDR